jgi:putative MATE family efflux protein
MKKMSELDQQGCYSYKKIGAVTIPILLSMLMEQIIGMTDTAFLGRVNEVALGASALGTVYFLAFFVLGTGFSFGAQILIARRNGEKKFRKTGRICYAGGFFLILLSVVLTVVIKYLSPILLPYMIKSEDICKATIEYLDWRAYGLIFAFAASILRAFYVGIAQTRILTYSSIAMVLSNILLNYALIFGKFGMPEMGIAGAALASSIAEAISLICYIFYTVKFIDLKKYGFYSVSAIFSPDILKKVFTVSFWMMLQPFISVGVWFFFFIAVERLGERSLAVVNIVRSLSALPFIIIHAFATSTNSLVSNLIGENKVSQVWRLIGKIMISAFAIVVPILVFYAVFPTLSMRIYTDNPDLISSSSNAVYVMCVASFIQIAAFILFNAVSGTGAIKTIVIIEFLNLFIYVLFVWLVIIRHHPSPAVAWSSEILYQGFIVLSCLLYLFFGNWRNKKI